jgi:hypothetical protein
MVCSPVVFDPDARLIRAGEWVQPLDSIERLWLIVAVFPGIPDERSHRWVLQTAKDVVLMPGLSLPTKMHLEALDAWGQQTKRLYLVERYGWPLYWGTLRFAWAAFRRRCERFDLDVWKTTITRDAEVSGPCGMQTLLEAW